MMAIGKGADEQMVGLHWWRHMAAHLLLISCPVAFVFCGSLILRHAILWHELLLYHQSSKLARLRLLQPTALHNLTQCWCEAFASCCRPSQCC